MTQPGNTNQSMAQLANQNGQQMVQQIMNTNQNQGISLNPSTHHMIAQTPQQNYNQYPPQRNYDQIIPQQNYNQNFSGRGFSRGRGFQEEGVITTMHGTLTKLIAKYVGDNTTCTIVINSNMVKI